MKRSLTDSSPSEVNDSLREIGGEFWDIPMTDSDDTLFPDKTQWFLSGRSALMSILNDIKAAKKCKKAYLPSWCCDSVIIPFLKLGLRVEFYSVYPENGGLVQNIPDEKDDEIILVMDFFGYHNYFGDVQNGTVIRDLTHSVFMGVPDDADHYFGSLRKWCGVCTGGFAWTSSGKRLSVYDEADEEYAMLRKRAMDEKSRYIRKEIDDKSFLELFLFFRVSVTLFPFVSVFTLRYCPPG